MGYFGALVQSWPHLEEQYEARGNFPLHAVHILPLCIAHLLPGSVSNSVMPKEKEEDLGARFASYYTPEENVDKPLPPSMIEATRDKRQKDYAAIAKEWVVICSPCTSLD